MNPSSVAASSPVDTHRLEDDMALLEPISPPPHPAELSAEASPAARRWRWTGDDLIRLGEAGLLPPEARFELLDGEIYQLMPPGPLHAFVVELIDRLLEALAQARGAHSRAQNPIRLNLEYDPQPDVAVVRGPVETYRDRFPGPEDVLLVVEAADSSVEHDRRRKVPAYATAGIPECWLVNLPEQQVEVYREPVDGEYRLLRLCRTGEFLEPLALPGAALAVSEILGDVQQGTEQAPTL